MVKPRTTKHKKTEMLRALQKTYGLITNATAQVGINRTTHYLWINTDPEYREAVENVKDEKKDFVESALFKLIKKGDTAAVIFSAKTLLKDRGYVERYQYANVDTNGNDIEPCEIILPNGKKVLIP